MSESRYSDPPTAADIAKSVASAVEGILALDILRQHKRVLIDAMIWKLTEAEGKYTTRYQSAGVWKTGREVKRQHEHVVPRKDLIARIFDRPDDVRAILKDAIGCVVTREEHAALTRLSCERPDLKGWQRYSEAGIKVVDSRTGEPVDLAWM